VLLVVLALLTLLELVGLSFVFVASSGRSTPRIERALNEIEVAQTALGRLIQNPDDPLLGKVAVVNVGQALLASADANRELEANPTPETRRLAGLLQAACSLFGVLTRLLGVPDC
jgi:hypothetical protein